MTSIFEATQAYETWLRRNVNVIESDLAEKHQRMSKSAFSFFRATFYRWVPTWQEACPALTPAPKILAVGDLHIENFGTWRDSEGRLVWGINDFDEAATMPYTIDLVRLATSAVLARKEKKLRTNGAAACHSILNGYTQQLQNGGKPFVLEEHHEPLRAAALSTERDPAIYWEKLDSLPSVNLPQTVRKILTAALPRDSTNVRFIHRTAGAGSLGRPRYLALAKLDGANIAREAKAMMPSAYGWANGKVDTALYCDDVGLSAVRSRDPYTVLKGKWLIRRLGPRCSRIDLDMLPAKHDEKYVLGAMGRETANVHLGNRAATKRIRAHLKRLPHDWLETAATTMANSVIADWKAWRTIYPS